MKKTAFAMVLALGSMIAPGATAQDFAVIRSVQPIAAALKDLHFEVTDKKVNFVGEGADRSPLGSVLALRITGKYEGGWCRIGDLALRLTPARTRSWLNEAYTMELVGMESSSDGALPISGQACAGGSSGSFSFPAKVVISRWSRGESAASWIYRLPLNPYDLSQRLEAEVTFDMNTGWSLIVR